MPLKPLLMDKKVPPYLSLYVRLTSATVKKVDKHEFFGTPGGTSVSWLWM